MTALNAYSTVLGTSSGRASVLTAHVITKNRVKRDPRRSAEYRALVRQTLTAVKKRPAPTRDWSERIATEMTDATD